MVITSKGEVTFAQVVFESIDSLQEVLTSHFGTIPGLITGESSSTDQIFNETENGSF